MCLPPLTVTFQDRADFSVETRVIKVVPIGSLAVDAGQRRGSAIFGQVTAKTTFGAECVRTLNLKTAVPSGVTWS